MNHENSNTGNKMLRLAEELRSLTIGLCRVGPGPYGFGVFTSRLSDVGAIICLEPDPYWEKLLPDGFTEYTATVRPIDTRREGGSYGRGISDARLLELAQGGDIATQAAAKGLLQICGKPVVVSAQEDSDAFDAMVSAELRGQNDGFTAEEAQQLSEMRWYESKPPIEIAGFQLFEDRLCMPPEVFHTALESALGRTVRPDELSCRRQELQAEYQAVCLGITTQERPEPEVGMTMPGL